MCAYARAASLVERRHLVIEGHAQHSLVSETNDSRRRTAVKLRRAAVLLAGKQPSRIRADTSGDRIRGGFVTHRAMVHERSGGPVTVQLTEVGIKLVGSLRLNDRAARSVTSDNGQDVHPRRRIGPA